MASTAIEYAFQHYMAQNRINQVIEMFNKEILIPLVNDYFRDILSVGPEGLARRARYAAHRLFNDAQLKKANIYRRVV